MGHYDSCYEHDQEEFEEQMLGRNRRRLEETIQNLSLEDTEFIIQVCSRIDDMKAFFRVINHLKPQ